jgi:hypothetical protein
MSNIKMTPLWKRIVLRHISCNTPGRNCPRSLIGLKATFSNPWGTPNGALRDANLVPH